MAGRPALRHGQLRRPRHRPSASTSRSSTGTMTTTAVVVHPPTGETYWADGGRFGTHRSRERPAAEPSRRHQRRRSARPRLRGCPARRRSRRSARPSTRVSSRRRWRSPGSRRAGDWRTSPTAGASAACTSLRGSRCAGRPGVVITDFDGAPVHTGPGRGRGTRRRVPRDACSSSSRATASPRSARDSHEQGPS